MRVLLLLRGAPGCGKSTFIDYNGLRPYALSADEIRLLCQSPQQTPDGSVQIGVNHEEKTWRILFDLLEARMESGEFTIIDATNSKTSEMNRYKEMADTYRYRMYCVDFTDLPIEECKRRNAGREPLKRVPDEAIDKMYARFKTQKIPSGIKVIKPSELSTIWMKPIDFSKYNKIVHIGDIHGCYTALKEYFDKNDIADENTFYIFTGDYIDRGIENVEVMNFLFEAAKRKNVFLLEGNHDRSIQIYGHGGASRNKEFEFGTRKQFEDAHIDTKELRNLYRRFGQCAYYTYDDKTVLVCHGGVATVPDNITKLATCQLINGVGKFSDADTVEDTWMNTTENNMYQIHGHRNTKMSPIQSRDRVFNLDGAVEHGGELRIVELTHDGFKCIGIKNTVFAEDASLENMSESSEVGANDTVADLILKLRADKKNIEEKNFGHISSFNFTRDAFINKDNWNSRTVKARGLYIDVDKQKIAARSFDKFFNVNEMPFTKFDMLKNKLKFPVKAYVKENGFLGIVAYDEYGDYEDNLIVTSKSSITGDFSGWLRDMLNRKTEYDTRKKMAEFCKANDCSLVFECVDMGNDPHIIEYPESELYLLACVNNEIEFKQMSYNKLEKLGRELGLKVKTLAYTLNNWSEFYDWYTEVNADDYKFNDRIIEGFVIEDASGFMTKIKLSYYQFWKHMRAVARETLRYGYIRKTGALTDETSNMFYGFCRNLYNEAGSPVMRDLIPRDIVYLRKRFYDSLKK